MTLQEFLRIKSEKVKKAILDNYFREYDQFEVVHEKYKESNNKYYKFLIQFLVNYDEKAEYLKIIQVLSDISRFDIVPLIHQMIAYFYMLNVKYGKAFMVYVKTGSEKITFLNIFVPNKKIYFKSGLSLNMSSLSELFKEWNELNNKAGASMGQFDFSTIKEIRKEQSKLENSIFEVLKKHAPDEILKILPEECGEMEMGYETKGNIFYFVMLDPEFIEDEEIKLLAITIDLKNKVDLIKDFEIKD